MERSADNANAFIGRLCSSPSSRPMPLTMQQLIDLCEHPHFDRVPVAFSGQKSGYFLRSFGIAQGNDTPHAGIGRAW
jgi:hypothetical protein